jgi:type I restriction enzyme M protein
MQLDQTLELVPVSHRSAFQNIRNFLAGRLLGATRDRTLMDELFKCVFAKHWLLKSPSLVIGGDLSKSYRAAFAHVKRFLPGIFLPADEIELDPAALQYVDRQFEAIDFENCRADIFSELYEAFAGSGVKASEGQFFTPIVAVNLLLEMVNPKPSQMVCDPACGAGGFLIAVAKHLVAAGAKTKDVAASLRGVDKDAYLTRVARGRLALFLDEMPEVICGDSLAGVSQDGTPIEANGFDIVLTNPPFGAKIVAASARTLLRYDLARRWVKAEDGKDGKEAFVVNGGMNASTPVQVLFVERCLNLLNPGGFLGIILPESIVSSKSHGYVVQYVQSKAELISVVGMPEALFKTSGKGGTHTKTVAAVFQKKPTKGRRSAVFFAEAKWCGHDSRGRSVPLNDVPQIAMYFAEFRRTGRVNHGHLGISVPRERLGLNLAPRAFEFDAETEAERLAETHEIVAFGDLVKKGVLSLSTGDEVGKLAYGTGDIPFVRTSDISNWELKLDPKHCVSEEIYERFKARQDVRPNDILIVRDGTYLIGTCAIITEYDLPMLYQSHIYKIRVEDASRINPFLLLAALNSEFVQRQIKSFCISQDIIDSLGDKIHQVRLALPKAKDWRSRIANLVEKVIRDRIEARELARKATEEIMAG